MKIKAIAPWFGAKRNLAPVIVDLIGSHQVYWEPFCGSMAVLMAKAPCEMETVNDLNGDLVNLAKVIRDKELAFELYDKLCRTLYSEQLFKESKERCFSAGKTYEGPCIEKAYDFFVASWMGLNGISGTKRCNYQFALRWCVGGGQGARRWRSVVESMPAWHKRLQNVVIIQRDAFGVLEKIRDERGSAIYCDPPYFEKSSKYVHDFKDADHEQLAESLRRFKKTRVLVSYYDHPALATLYEGWNKIFPGKARRSLRNATGAKGKAGKSQTEILLTNQQTEGRLF